MSGIACDNNCSHQFKGGEKVTLTAVPAPEWSFKEWQGDCDQTGQVVMDKDKKCQATFISVTAGIDKIAYQNEVTYFKAKVIIPGHQSTLNYQWDFGDGNTANTVMASHTYTTTGIYTAAFTVIDDQGLVGSDTLLVEVKQATAKVVPQEILKEIEEKGGSRIIIGLNLATQLEGQLSTPAAISTQRTRIAQVQQQFINSLRTSLISSPADANTKNLATPTMFTTIPYVAMGVNAIQLAHIRENPLVTSIEPDELSFPILHDSVPLIGGINAHNNGYSGTGQTIAILDTGVDSAHPDLAGKVISEACYSKTYAPDSSTSLCPGGSDEQVGAGAAVPCAISKCTHGTHVAGIAAANGSVIGVANEANIIAIQVFSRFDDSSHCSSPPCILSYNSDQIKGLEQILTLHGSGYSIASANLSLGGECKNNDGDSEKCNTTYCDSDFPSYKAAIDNLHSVGIATVTSSGNEWHSDRISFPACISSAISVGATDKLDNVAPYSNSAAILELLAPGSNITSTIPGGTTGSKSGTSMAAPHVTGTWAVLKAMIPTASVDQVLTTLETTGKPITDPRNGLVKPRIQVDQALVELPCNSPTIRSQADGQWTNPSTWNLSHQPNSTDVVLVEHHVEVNIVPAVVKFLCNQGQLTSQSNTSLEIQATGGINNVSNILGDRDVILKTAATVENYEKEGDYWWYTLETTPGPIFNEGTIVGGDGDFISSQGGNVILLGRNVTNTGSIQGGKGNDILVGNGGKGGTVQVFARFGGSQWGNAGNLISSGSILAGNGGDGGSWGGQGGNLWLVGYPNVYLGISAEWKDFCFMCPSTGVAGHSAGQGGSPGGGDGWVMIEPSSINIAAGTIIKGGDITIFGGDDWTLKLSEEPSIESSGNVTLAVGNNSVVDLTKNTKPIIKSANQVNIFADDVRTDAGITLANLIEAGSGIMTEPSKILHQFTLVGASYLSGQPGETIVIRLTLINNGPTTDTYHLTSSSSSGNWHQGQLPAIVEVAGLDTIEFGTEVTLPATPGAQNTITVTATSQHDPSVSASTAITITVGDDTTSSLPPDDIHSGTVSDQSGVPLAGASLTIGDKIFTTDENGHWQMESSATPTSGTLYDAQGNPLAGAIIKFGDQMLTTDANGHWELTQPNAVGNASLDTPATASFSLLPPQTPACYASGLIDWVCNANGQQLTDLTVGPNGMIAYGTLVGTLTNQGWVSNLTLEFNSHLTGGIVTGYINNHGEMADFEFRGAAIVGGTLAGEISNTSQIDGYFRDVQLAANAHLSGGNLQSNISGDYNAPALLENVTIKSGSYLAGVRLGNGVIVEDNVTCGENVQAPDGVCQLASSPVSLELTDLGATASNKNGEIIPSHVAIRGGIAVNHGPVKSQAIVTLADEVTIQGQIQVDPAQVGQSGEVVVYVEYTPIGANEPVDIMLNNKGEPVEWDNDLAHLVPFRVIPKLDEQPLTILMYQGKFSVTGTLKIGFGYRLTSGLVVHSLKPIEVNINK